MGRHIVSLATLMKPIATSSALLAGCPAVSACALTSSATRSNASLQSSAEQRRLQRVWEAETLVEGQNRCRRCFAI